MMQKYDADHGSGSLLLRPYRVGPGIEKGANNALRPYFAGRDFVADSAKRSTNLAESLLFAAAIDSPWPKKTFSVALIFSTVLDVIRLCRIILVCIASLKRSCFRGSWRMP